ncbi:MAG: hydantoinase/oxoprolinase family protein [Chloroflexota bacterium]|jgi:N-methylhydantoinase A
MAKRDRLMKVGVDTGGTFTDFAWLDGAGRIQVHKELSTPADPAEAIIHGLAHLQVPRETAIVHGSTVATNALLERRGARTALIASRGFGDVLAIGRQERPDLYALVPRRPEPLVPDGWRFEVGERVTAAGRVQEPLDEADLARAIDSLLSEGVESVAVCLLFSFLYPQHERRIAQVIRDRLAAAGQPGRIHVSLSSDILPEYREYERTATTVINAYVAPTMAGYLGRLEGEVKPRPLAVMQSNGGIISAARAGREAARTVLSGPAGGVVGAMHVARLAGLEEIITFDMGGTSTDVALCPGELPATIEGHIAGLPLRLPIIDIHTVGAGGGSLASVDPGGALRVGPRSAGAAPGPACYGKTDGGGVPDGQRTTVTDANLVLGRLDADRFLGGTMSLNAAAARRVMSKLAALIGAQSVEQAAWGVVRVANANIERAIRRISVERGYDPRSFTLVAFGGAGPLHACELAAEMAIPRVLIPPSPGVLSALGMLVARPSRDYSLTVMRQLQPGVDEGASWLNEQYAALAIQAEAEMAAEGYGRDTFHLEQRLDMRYQGQSHELTVAIAPGQGEAEMAFAFHRAHAERYGFGWPDKPVQIVNLRLAVEVQETAPALPRLVPGGEDSGPALIGRKPVWFGAQAMVSNLYDRAKLAAGNRFRGPAIVFQYDTTSVAPPGWEALVDDYGNLILSKVS